jgi:hypothetical protein
MSQRSIDDAEIQRVVKTIRNEATLRTSTESWSAADVQYGIEYLDDHRDRVDWSWQRDSVLPLLRDIRREKSEADSRAAAEEADERRFRNLSEKIEALKEPHWSTAPNFWLTVAILILTAIGATAAVLSLFR